MARNVPHPLFPQRCLQGRAFFRENPIDRQDGFASLTLCQVLLARLGRAINALDAGLIHVNAPRAPQRARLRPVTPDLLRV